MIKKKSSFAGFLNGYKARNIASIAPTLQVHVDEITNNINVLIDLMITHKKSDELINLLKKSYTLLQRYDDDLLRRLLFFAEMFNIYIDLHKELIDKEDTDINQRVKKIIYHLLALAEISEDKKLSSLAINVGEKI